MGRQVPGQLQGHACYLGARPVRRSGALTEWGVPVDTGMIFMDCPAYMDKHGAVRCGLPAEAEHRYAVQSSDGPVESAKVRCPRGHWFNGSVESLTWDKRTSAIVLGAASQKQNATSLQARKAGPD